MKYKDLGYKNEFKDFSLSIGLSLFMFLAFFIGTLLEGLSLTVSLIVSFFSTLVLSIIVLVNNIKGYKFYKKNQEIKNNGRRINGYVSSFEYSVTNGKYQRAEYTLVINYIDPFSGINCVYKTPVVNFDIFNDLGSRNCSVYLYNDMIYVSDYIRKMPNDSYVWEESIISQYNPQKLVKDASKKRLKSIGLFFLILILILLFFGIFAF